MAADLVSFVMGSSSTSRQQESLITATGTGPGLQSNMRIDTKNKIHGSQSIKIETSSRF